MAILGLEPPWPLEADLQQSRYFGTGITFVELILHTVTSCSSLTQQPKQLHFIATPSLLPEHIAANKPPILLDFGLRTGPSAQRCSKNLQRLVVTQERQLTVHLPLSQPRQSEGRGF